MCQIIATILRKELLWQHYLTLFKIIDPFYRQKWGLLLACPTLPEDMKDPGWRETSVAAAAWTAEQLPLSADTWICNTFDHSKGSDTGTLNPRVLVSTSLNNATFANNGVTWDCTFLLPKELRMPGGLVPTGEKRSSGSYKEECSNGDWGKRCPHTGRLKAIWRNGPQIRSGSHLNYYLRHSFPV